MYRTKEPRKPADDYQTNSLLADAVCQRLSFLIPPPKVVVEPSAGEGSFVAASRLQWPASTIHAVEIRKICVNSLHESGASSIYACSWEEWGPPLSAPIDLIIGNPPFVFAQEHLELALQRVRDGGLIAFLLRMSFLGTQDRVKSFWDKQPGLRWLLPLAQRPSFMDTGKSDNSEYSIFCLQKGWKNPSEILPHLWVTYPRAKRGPRSSAPENAELSFGEEDTNPGIPEEEGVLNTPT